MVFNLKTIRETVSSFSLELLINYGNCKRARHFYFVYLIQQHETFPFDPYFHFLEHSLVSLRYKRFVLFLLYSTFASQFLWIRRVSCRKSRRSSSIFCSVPERRRNSLKFAEKFQGVRIQRCG